MRFLIVEDDFTSRRLLQMYLAAHGECDIAVNGTEALEAVAMARAEKRPYALICLDVLMPELCGTEVLKAIRAEEKRAGTPPQNEVKIVMTTALDSPRDVVDAYYHGGCNGYLVKPVRRSALDDLLREYGLAAAGC